MKTYRHVVGWLFLVVAVAVLVGLQLPSQWRAEARVAVAADAVDVFPHLSDVKAWRHWAVWFDHDPHMSVQWSEPTTGVGAGYQWNGNASVGEGELRITNLAEPNWVDLLLTMDEGRFKSEGRIELVSQANQVEVTWSQQGSFGHDLFGRLQRRLLERSVAATLQASLDRLQRIVERSAPDGKSGRAVPGQFENQATVMRELAD